MHWLGLFPAAGDTICAVPYCRQVADRYAVVLARGSIVAIEVCARCGEAAQARENKICHFDLSPDWFHPKEGIQHRLRGSKAERRPGTRPHPVGP